MLRPRYNWCLDCEYSDQERDSLTLVFLPPKRGRFVQGTIWLVPIRPLFGGSIVPPESSCPFAFSGSPKDTPFEDGTFKLTMQFSEEYPNKPPVVRFVSKMFHPNGKPVQGTMETTWLCFWLVQCMQMVAYVSTYYKTDGVQPTMFLPYWHQYRCVCYVCRGVGFGVHYMEFCVCIVQVYIEFCTVYVHNVLCV